jgi:hypothetical protein
MNKTGILLLYFAIPFLLHVGFNLFMSAFRSGESGSFDRFGTSWILLKSIYYGILGLLMGLSVRELPYPAPLRIFVFCCFLIVTATWASDGKVILPDQALNRLGTSVDRLGLRKKVLVETAALGNVTDIVVDEHNLTTIAGNRGAISLGAHGKITSTVSFGGQVDDISIVRLEDKHSYQFLSRGSWSSPASLHDASGNTLWTYSNDVGVDDTAYGDIDGDGHFEFVVGMNGDAGVSLLDQHGKEIWNKPDGNVFHVEVTDPDQTGHCQIVQTGSSFRVRNFAGKITSEVAIPGLYCGSFSLCHWPEKHSKQCVIACSEGYAWLVSLDGKVLKRLKLENDRQLDQTYGVPIRLRPGEPNYLAVLAVNAIHDSDRALLRIYSPSGEVVYSEVLAEDCSAVAVEPAQASMPEKLLVGARSRVWRYEIDR